MFRLARFFFKINNIGKMFHYRRGVARWFRKPTASPLPVTTTIAATSSSSSSKAGFCSSSSTAGFIGCDHRDTRKTTGILQQQRRFGSSTSTCTTGLSLLKESYENIVVEILLVPSSSEVEAADKNNMNTKTKTQIAIVKLNRPKTMNALNDELFHDLLHATNVLNDDSTVRCIVLMSSSSKAFAAGADITEMCSKTFEDVYNTDMFAEWQQISKLSSTPIIAAISGYCLGGGNELAMMCDIMVCTKNAKFGQPEINLGIIPGAGGTQRLTRIIGKSKSMYMNMTGEFLSAEDAYGSGLVAKVYNDYDELLDGSIAMANNIASKGRTSIRAIKEAITAAEELPLQEGLRLERRLFHSLFATHDQKEGMKAFLEKRPPNFK